jgi:hypothetical protein
VFSFDVKVQVIFLSFSFFLFLIDGEIQNVETKKSYGHLTDHSRAVAAVARRR